MGENENTVRILLLEDNPQDAEYLQEVLDSVEEFRRRYVVQNVTHLADAQSILVESPPDVLLLDLCLPDSTGMATLDALQEHIGSIPTVVLTGNTDHEMSMKALYAGAQDYLTKGEFDGPLIVRAIRYAMERHRLQRELARERASRDRERETLRLERLGHPGPSVITAGLYGTADLADLAPEVFGSFVGRYREILDLVVEERSFRVNHHSSEKLRKLAAELGFLKAGPRDVIRIYTSALNAIPKRTTRAKTDVLMEEGRVSVIELMGFLVAWYRNRAAMEQAGSLKQESSTQ